MSLIKISQVKRGNIPVTIFQLQDRISLGNYKELEVAAQEAYENGMRNLVIDLSSSDSLTTSQQGSRLPRGRKTTAPSTSQSA